MSRDDELAGDSNSIINQKSYLESYCYTGGKWSDMTAMKDSLLERANRQCTADLESNRALPDIKYDQKTLTVDNYPIKAISAPIG